MANIVIKISSDASGSGVTQNQEKTTGAKPVNETPNQVGDNKVSDTTKMVNAMMIQNGKKILTTAVNTYVDLTGNSALGNKISSFGTISGYAMAIKTAGWIGAVAVAVDIGLQAFTSSVETNRTNAQIELLRQRTGNSAINGSRGTYD